MLGILCSRPKPWTLTSLSFLHCSAAHHHHHFSRLLPTRPLLADLADGTRHRRHHSSPCWLSGDLSCGAASIWHSILPSGSGRRRDYFLRSAVQHERKGEGSWNVAWDARPARWLHRPDSAWLLFGVCACLAPIDWAEEAIVDEKIDGSDLKSSNPDKNGESSPDYRVTGVLADGRCLFRAIAHCACLRKGEEAPRELSERTC